MENFLKKNCRRTLFPKNTNLPPAISKKKIKNDDHPEKIPYDEKENLSSASVSTVTKKIKKTAYIPIRTMSTQRTALLKIGAKFQRFTYKEDKLQNVQSTISFKKKNGSIEMFRIIPDSDLKMPLDLQYSFISHSIDNDIETDNDQIVVAIERLQKSLEQASAQV